MGESKIHRKILLGVPYFCILVCVSLPHYFVATFSPISRVMGESKIHRQYVWGFLIFVFWYVSLFLTTLLLLSHPPRERYIGNTFGGSLFSIREQCDFEAKF